MSEPHTPTPREAAAAEHLGNVNPSETVHHDSRSKVHRPVSRMDEMNLTAMLDVCFLLLIFFVLTANFDLGEGILPADLPQGESQADADQLPPTQPVEISLRSLGGGEVAIDLVGSPSAPATFHELFVNLNQMMNSGIYEADTAVIIHAESSVRWTHLVNAFNSAFRARFTNINFAQPRN